MAEQQRARQLRAEAWTLRDIATELGVSKSSVSLWVRDVAFTPRPRNRGHPSMKPHPAHARKLAEIERCRQEALERIGVLSERELLVAGLLLYAGEGAKADGTVKFANTNPVLVTFFLHWLRTFFDVAEERLRVALYLHEGLDLAAAVSFWSALTAIPASQFTKPYRAVADRTRRRAKHVLGCPAVVYAHSTTHRRVMAMIEAVTSEAAFPG